MIKASTLRMLPAEQDGWFALLLLPFKVYVATGLVWLHFWDMGTRKFRVRGMLHSEEYELGWIYFWCSVVFLIAAVIQFRTGRRRCSLGNFIFAIVTFGICIYLLSPF
jgi:hypothetical protein